MKCEIIKDLLPSYIDGICSDDSANLVAEHLQTCPKCTAVASAMKQEVLTSQQQKENLKAKNPFARIRKLKITHMVIAVLLTVLLVVAANQIYQEVGYVHDLFSPVMTAIAEPYEGKVGWEQLTMHRFSYPEEGFVSYQYLNFNSIFFKKEIVNDSEVAVTLRICDTDGNIIIDKIPVQSHRSIELEELNRNEDYILEMQACDEPVFLNII